MKVTKGLEKWIQKKQREHLSQHFCLPTCMHLVQHSSICSSNKCQYCQYRSFISRIPASAFANAGIFHCSTRKRSGA